ncbi:MAG: phospho-sugar mutase [Cyclobacteriaceae bacterium]
MDISVKSKIDSWLAGNYDLSTKNEIKKMLDSGNEKALIDAFYRNLEFGTGGLRGIMGVGSNRINKYTIGAATQGIANYLKRNFPNKDLSAAIAHDSRNNSDVFANIVADVFSANGIKVFLFEALRSTPELSFAIRELDCDTGVVLTASHNPKEYNGFKAYWNDGAQVIPPHDKNIISEVQAIQSVDDILFDRDEALVEMIGESLDNIYLEKISGLSLSLESIQKQHDLSIVFSPIHGTGITLVPQLLKKIGFTNVTVLEEQAVPDGNFPTVVYPNPEEQEAMSLAVKKGTDINAELIMATDPDADRVGIAVRNLKGDFELLNGNQTGALLVYYVLLKNKELGLLKGQEFTVKTIVTTELITAISNEFGVEMFDVLTGFKYIAGLIKDLEGKKKYLVGGEESYGYLISDLVRDKDAVASCAFIAEMAAYFKEKGKSLYQVLVGLYVEHGFYKESLKSLTKKGKSGQEEIAQLMEAFRKNPPKEIAGEKLVLVKDYLLNEEKDVESGEVQQIDLPSSNVLQFFTEKGSKISMRPSGTEPKIKFYVGVKGELSGENDFDKIHESLNNKMDQLMESLGV